MKIRNPKSFLDQMGREIKISFPPQRIISVVPSQTELLFDLGLNEEVAGITKFCIHPNEMFKTKTKVGGTKNLNIEKIKSLHPDLIIANKEENDEQQIKELPKLFPVWISNIKTLSDAYEMMQAVGEMVNRKQEASELVKKISSTFLNRKSQVANPKSCYLIWYDPIMTIGKDTFIHHLLEVAGFKNIFSERKRYPEITIKEIQDLNPEFILLSSEPYPFKQKHIEELQPHFPKTKILLIDGEMFSWYGSRLLHAPEYFRRLEETLRQ